MTVRNGTGYTVGSPSSAMVTVNDNDVPPPAKPTGFTATAGDRQVILSWTDPKNSDITKYQYRQKEGSDSYGSWTDIAGSGATTVTHTVSRLTNGTAYTFQVRAVAGTTNGVQLDEMTATPAPSANLVVKLTVAEAGGGDFVAVGDEGDQTVIIPTSSSATYTIATVNDDTDEPNGSVMVTVENGNGYALGSTVSATVMVNDDDDPVPAIPVITIAVGTSPVTEGIAASFTVTAAPAPSANLEVNLSVAEAAGSDFVASGDEGTKTVNIPTSGSATYFVATVADDMDEPNGSVTVTVADDTGYTVGDPASATVMVNDDDEAPLGAVEDAQEAVIFPNPSGHYLEIRSNTGGTFQILSLSGEPLLESPTNTRIDITSLRSGLYLAQLPDGRLLKFVRE